MTGRKSKAKGVIVKEAPVSNTIGRVGVDGTKPEVTGDAAVAVEATAGLGSTIAGGASVAGATAIGVGKMSPIVRRDR